MKRSRRTGKRPQIPVWQRWAWFRIGALEACRRLPRTTAELRELLGVEPKARRVQLRNQSNMVRWGFLTRGADGYRTTPRGRRVLEDVRSVEIAEVG